MCTCFIFICHFFSEVPEDINNPDESHNKYENSISSLKTIYKKFKNAFKFIFSSKRLKSLFIYFNAIFYSIIYLLITYRRSPF